MNTNQIDQVLAQREYKIDETREFKDGIQEIERIDGDSYGIISYDGYVRDVRKELESNGFIVIDNN